MTNLANFDLISLFWSEVGFEPWEWNGIGGARRRVIFRKDSLLGEVASYYADDYIVWKYNDDRVGDYILAHWSPKTDVMAHRFLILGSQTWSRPRSRSFLLGIKGWVDVFYYCIGSKENNKFKDLIFLANKGYEFAQKEVNQ